MTHPPVLDRGRRQNYRLGFAAAALTIGVVFTGARPASAQSSQVLAQFIQPSGTGSPFVFTYTGSGATFTGSAQVDFNFTPLSGLSTNIQAATATLTASTLTPAQAVSVLIDQPVDVVSTLAITRNSDHANLLTATFTGDLLGVQGTPNAVLQATQGINGRSVSFSSSVYDFSKFSSGSPVSFQFDVGSVTPDLSIGAGGYVTSFTTSAFGAFLVPSVPEPNSLFLASAGLTSIGAVAALRKLKAAHSTQTTQAN